MVQENSHQVLTSIKVPRKLYTTLSGLPIKATTLLGLPIKASTHAPICVAPKRGKSASKKCPNKYISSPLIDSHGFPDRQDNFKAMPPEVKDGCLVCKQKHITHPLTDIDPNFGVEYAELLHGAILSKELDVYHLTPPQQIVLTALIKKYWHVFNKEGVTTPVKDYE